MVSLLRKRESSISRHLTKRNCCLRRNGQWWHLADVLPFGNRFGRQQPGPSFKIR